MKNSKKGLLMLIHIKSKNVCQYLIDKNICQQQDVELANVESRPTKEGRSKFISLIVKLQSGCQLIIKQSYQFYDNKNFITYSEYRLIKFLQSFPDLSCSYFLNLTSIYFDDINHILIYKYPKDYINLESYYSKQKAFSTKIAELVGKTLASLHCDTFNSENCFNFLNTASEGQLYYQFPYPAHILDRLEPETLLKEVPPEGYKFIAIYQRSERLRSSIIKLLADCNNCCLTHNNPQLDNILVPTRWEELLFITKKSDESQIKLINLEQCSWGDPAFDLGTVISGYLLLWLNSLVVHPTIELEKSLQLATIPLEVIQPSILTLTKSYISNFPKVLEKDPNFVIRVVRFTGLALIYKILAMIQSFKSFDNHCIYMLQLSKSLICSPEKSFESVFGIKSLTFN
jgi:hypothetical protein